MHHDNHKNTINLVSLIFTLYYNGSNAVSVSELQQWIYKAGFSIPKSVKFKVHKHN